MNGRSSRHGLGVCDASAQGRTMSSVMFTVLCVTSVVVSPALAAGPTRHSDENPAFHQELLQDQLSVRELMRLDAEQALQRLRKGGASPSPVLSPSQLPDSQRHSRLPPRLVAIYGVGNRLLAEITWKGQSYVYLKGQPSPVGRNSHASLRLQTLSSRCATLRDDEQRFELCLGHSGSGG